MAKSTPAKPDEPSSADLLATFMEDTKGSDYNHVTPVNRVISTGSLLLDSHVRIRSGNVVRFSGLGAELGKTSETLVLLSNFMAEMPKAKCIFVKAEARLSEELKKRSGLTFVYHAKDWVTGTIFVYSGNEFEKVASLIEILLKDMHAKGEHLGIAIDSLDGLILQADTAANKDVWGGKESPKVAGVPLLTKLLFRRIALPIVHFDALLIITSQYSAPISLDPYAPAGPRQVSGGGGSSAMHQSDYVFEFAQRNKSDDILEKPGEKPDYKTNKTIGVWATYVIKKSATDISGARIKVPIKKGRIGSAIWVEREVVDLAIYWSMIRKAKGSWLEFNPDTAAKAKEDGIVLREKVNGMDALYGYFEEDKAVCDWFLAEIRKTLPS